MFNKNTKSSKTKSISMPTTPKIYEKLIEFLQNKKFEEAKIEAKNQSSNEPGILRLYEPDFDYLLEEATCIIFKGNRPHSSLYSGTKDRVIIGLNFYVT